MAKKAWLERNKRKAKTVAKYAAKRSDCASCTTTDFDTKIFDAFKLGRAMITAKESRTDIAAQRAIILEEWEKVNN